MGKYLFLVLVFIGSTGCEVLKTKIPGGGSLTEPTPNLPVPIPTAEPEPTPTPTPTARTFIYVASGSTYAGQGITTLTPTALITRFTESGKMDCVIKDYNNGSGDLPVSLANYDEKHILALVENPTNRRIVLLPKDCSGKEAIFLQSKRGLNDVLRGMQLTADGEILVSKTIAIEKFAKDGTRITFGGKAFIDDPKSVCATSKTLIPKFTLGPKDSVFMLHAAPGGNNQTNIIASTGYGGKADCLNAYDGPSAAHLPSAILYHSSGKMLVAYGSRLGPVHQVYSYDVSHDSMSNEVEAYNDPAQARGISKLAEMPDGTILVGNSASAFNNVVQMVLEDSKLSFLGELLPSSPYTQPVSDILVVTEP